MNEKKNNKELDYSQRQEVLIKHLKYIIQKIGFSENKIFI